MSKVNRRDFLKLTSTAIVLPFIKWNLPELKPIDEPVWLGRVTDPAIWAYADPRPGARREQWYPRDSVIRLLDSISTQGLMTHNPIWYLTHSGWVYSSWVQTVERQYNPIVRDIPENGFWGQVTIPFAELRAKPNERAVRLDRLYYSSVHLVIARVEDESGRSWYQLRDDRAPNTPQYVRGESLRLIPPEEMTPLSPDIENKRIEIDTRRQMVYAYENDRLVFSTRCSTGARFNVDSLGLVDFTTPIGEFSVIRKRPRRHMVGFEERSDGYDLPGVPFPTYLTPEGVAIHGAYWHNDFGRQRSHGCVNVHPDAAQWVYRWTRPITAYEDALVEVENGGTPIVVT